MDASGQKAALVGPCAEVESISSQFAAMSSFEEPRGYLTLLTLPLEVRSMILDSVFTSRIIRFAAPGACPSEKTEIFSKIYHEWHLGFLATSRKLCIEGRNTLLSVVADSTLILDGIVPSSEGQKDKLDKCLYTRKMLSLFVRQYGSRVGRLKLLHQYVENRIDLSSFGGLRNVFFEHEIYADFHVAHTTNTGNDVRMSFLAYAAQSTDQETQAAIRQRCSGLNRRGGLYSTSPPLLRRLVDDARDRGDNDLQFILLIRLIIGGNEIYETARIRHSEMLIDVKSDKTLDFKRLHVERF